MKKSHQIIKFTMFIFIIGLSFRAVAENTTMVPNALGGARSVRVAPALGAVSEKIPIMTSPGRRAIEPKLTLSFSVKILISYQ